MTTKSITLREHLAAEFRESLAACREERSACLRESDMDAVHDTRVASRRVLETMRMFDQVLESKPVEPLRRALRDWMRRSGMVRDTDIAMGLVRNSGVERCEGLLIAMQQRREALVRKALKCLGKPVPWPTKKEMGGWWRQSKRSDPEVLWDLESSSVDNGAMVLPWLLHRYVLRGEGLLLDEAEDAQFHRFRLRTKRFRYTAEWFAPLLPDTGAKALVAALKGFQQSLGAFQDSVAAGELLQNPDFRQHLNEAQAAALAEALVGRGVEAKQQFLTRWRDFADEFTWTDSRVRVRMGKASAPYAETEAAPLTAAAGTSG